MRKLLKILLPPFVGFLVYFLAVRYSPVYFNLRIDEIGMGNLESFIAFYRYSLPLLFVVAILTQILIVIPIHRFLHGAKILLQLAVSFDMFLICLLFATSISYAIWDTTTGKNHLYKLIAFMTAVQFIYWLINLVILNLLNPRTPKTSPES